MPMLAGGGAGPACTELCVMPEDALGVIPGPLDALHEPFADVTKIPTLGFGVGAATAAFPPCHSMGLSGLPGFFLPLKSAARHHHWPYQTVRIRHGSGERETPSLILFAEAAAG
jgi:hypothetical protein